jgi:hypothetical protein
LYYTIGGIVVNRFVILGSDVTPFATASIAGTYRTAIEKILYNVAPTSTFLANNLIPFRLQFPLEFVYFKRLWVRYAIVAKCHSISFVSTLNPASDVSDLIISRGNACIIEGLGDTFFPVVHFS